jgi:hypothetical protein
MTRRDLLSGSGGARMDARAARWYPSRMFFIRTFSLGMTFFLAGACGGKVVFDGQSTGAGGNVGVGGGGGAGGSASTGGSCDTLRAAFTQAFSAAQACNPTLNVAQCTGTAMLPDACACPTLLNEHNPTAVTAAKTARSAAAAAGCFTPCGAPCEGSGPGFCEPVGSGSTGKCAAALPD